MKIDNLLVAGCSFSSDFSSNNMANLIPHCIAIGQATGVAAAMAVQQNISPRKVEYHLLQRKLIKQGAVLPGIEVT